MIPMKCVIPDPLWEDEAKRRERLLTLMQQILAGTGASSMELVTFNLSYLKDTAKQKRSDSLRQERGQALQEAWEGAVCLDRMRRYLRRIADCMKPAVKSTSTGCTDLAELLNMVYREKDVIRERMQISLELDCPDGKMPVRAEKDALCFVCYSLLTNALRACACGGTVRLSLNRQGEESILTVTDDGCGADYAEKELRARFLDGFHGSLILCEEYCRRWGWSITVEERENGGTEAVLRLPASTEEELSGRRMVFYSPIRVQIDEEYMRTELQLELANLPALRRVDFTC